MFGPSTILAFAGLGLWFGQFKYPHDIHEQLVSVRPYLGYIGVVFMIPMSLYFLNMCYNLFRDIYSDIDFKKWICDVKCAMNIL